MKMKLNGESIKQFFVAHGDKLALATMTLLALVAVFFGLTQEKIPPELSPEQISERARDAQQRLSNTQFVDQEVGSAPWLGAPPYPVQQIPAAFSSMPPVEYPLVKLRGKREEPDFHPAEQVHVVSGRGLFAFQPGQIDPAVKKAMEEAAGGRFRGFDETKRPGVDPPPGSVARGQEYVVVTALVPVGAQTREYRRRFREAVHPPDIDPMEQNPEYYRYLIERAEVGPDGTPSQWKLINAPLNPDGYDALMRDPGIARRFQSWSITAQDIIPEVLVEPSLVYANFIEENDYEPWLPPLLLRDWTLADVCHPALEEMVAKLDDDVDAAPSRSSTSSTDPAAAGDQISHKLLRHFDFDVEPGKRYQYRVRLVLRNPNEGIEDRYLKDPDAKTGRYRITAPSDVSPVASIAPRTELLTGEAGFDRARNLRTKVLVSVWEDVRAALDLAEQEAQKIRLSRDRDAALKEVARLRGVWRGVENIQATIVYDVFDPRPQEPRERELLGVQLGEWINRVGETIVEHPLTGRRERLRGVRFHTNHLVVDLRGAGVLRPEDAGKRGVLFTEPAELLVLDAQGNLAIRSELDDQAEYRRRQPPRSADPS
jgi:hypothetical protein